MFSGLIQTVFVPRDVSRKMSCSGVGSLTANLLVFQINSIYDYFID